MNPTIYSLHIDFDFLPEEFGLLASLARWGEPQEFTADRLHAHFEAIDFAAYVRTSDNLFVGYTSALSNGLGAVYLDSLITHPEFDRDIIASLLLRSVLTHFEGQPVYAMPFIDEQSVFRAEGFKVYRREMIALANRNDQPTNDCQQDGPPNDAQLGSFRGGQV